MITWRIILALGIACLACGRSYGQGRIITFDGPPVIPPGTGGFTTYYYEDSMTFIPMDVGEKFSRAGGGREAFPENGTAYILQGLGNSLEGSRGGVSRFGLYSVDLSEFSTLYNYPWTIQFIAYRFDGNIVVIEFTTDGIIDGTGPLADFQTFYFGPEFSHLVRFDVPSYGFAMDNLVFFDAVPEPAVGGLVIVGIAVLSVQVLKRASAGRRQAKA